MANCPLCQANLTEEDVASGRCPACNILLVDYDAGASRDDWGGFAAERAEIANFIAANGIDNVMLLAGDAHMLAIDDGSNSDYSASGGGGFPVFQAGSLDRPGSVKGGPYSEGTYPGAGHFGLVTFTDNGSSMTVRLSGRNWLGEELVGYSFSVPRREPG
jgi:hypothetical protein